MQKKCTLKTGLKLKECGICVHAHTLSDMLQTAIHMYVCTKSKSSYMIIEVDKSGKKRIDSVGRGQLLSEAQEK